MGVDFWNPRPPSDPKPGRPCGVYITLDRQIKYGPGYAACFRHAKQYTPELRERFEDLMAEEPESAQAVQAEGDSRMGESAAAAEQPSAAQGSAIQAVARSSAAPAAAQEPRREPMEVGQAADPDVAVTECAVTVAESFEEIREAMRMRFHENFRLIVSLPTTHRTKDMLGTLAGQAFAGPPLPEDREVRSTFTTSCRRRTSRCD